MSPTQSQSPSPRPPADLPGWAPAEPGSRPETSPPGEPAPSPAGMPGPDQDAAAGPGGEDPAGETTTTSRTRRATSLGRLSQDGLEKAATTVFHGIGEALNGIAAEDDEDDVFLPTGEEAGGVGEAAARLMARRIPDLPGKGADASDIADVIAIVVHLGVYAARSLATWLPRRGRRKKQALKAPPEAASGQQGA